MERIAIINSSSFGRYFKEHVTALAQLGEVERIDLASTMEGKELAKRLEGVTIIIAGVTPFYTGAFFEENKTVKLIARHGIGYNNVDIEAAKKNGCTVSIVQPLVERDAVAENAVANLMAMVRRVTDAQRAAKTGRWQERASFMGHTLTGKTAGVIGCGNIGSRVAEILRHGFDMRLLVCDPKRDTAWADRQGAEFCDLATLCRESDVISLNASLNPTSYHMLNDDAFSKMKRGVYITNTARGDLIEEGAMIRALKDGIVQGLATDVMHEEPAPADHPYLAHPRVLVTPHTSAYTYECLRGMGDKCVDDVQKHVRGIKPDHALV